MSTTLKPPASPLDSCLVGIFANQLSKHARVLNIAGSSQQSWFQDHDFEVDALTEEQDLRLLSLKKESLDAVWSHLALERLTIDECHRVLGSFFMALKPRAGILFISFSRTRHPENALLSLLRQSGFQLLEKGTSPDHLGFLLRRA